MQFDALVVGGSFAGLSAAMQLARARRAVCVVDAGAPRNRFAAHAHGFFAQDGTPPFELLAQARAKLAPYPTVRFVDGRATAARAEGDGFTVSVDRGDTLTARRLLLAGGVTDTLPDVPGLRERWGATVLHCPYCHGYEVADRPLGVLATLPGSVHQAVLVADWGPVTFFLNGGEAPDDATRDLFRLRGVTVEPAPVVALEGPANGLDAVRLADGRRLPPAAMFVAPRTRPADGLAASLGCAFDDGMTGPHVRTDAMKQTTVPHVFAAGDAASMAHNATFASSDGVMAGVSMHRSLIPGF